MFPPRAFAPRYFAPRYFPDVGAELVTVILQATFRARPALSAVPSTEPALSGNPDMRELDK